MRKHSKKLVFLLVFALLISAVFVGCGGNEEAPPAEEDSTAEEPAEEGGETAGTPEDFHIEIKLSHVFAPNEQLTISTNAAADAIRERTNGAVDIQTYPQGQLATYKDGLEQVANGANFISVEDPSYIGDYVWTSKL